MRIGLCSEKVASRLNIIVFILLHFGGGVTAQVSSTPDVLCNNATNSSECLSADPSCAWCDDPSYNSTVRCLHVSGFPALGSGDSALGLCEPDFLKTLTESANSDSSAKSNQTIQVSPSAVNISVRPGQPVTFDVTVIPTRNFPVDMYFLMDLSFSTRDNLVNLQKLTAELATVISNTSQDFQLGFGSFVDKRVSPFVSLDTLLQNNPCPGVPAGCKSTYSYRHHIDLTNDTDFFNSTLQEIVISGNQDPPEGGFEGLLQSIVCRSLIGWRDVSHKLLFYISDAGFHIAGDGKLGGVVLPHDGLCKIDGTTAPQDYNDWITLDYPSIGQVAHALRENDIIPIFAVQETVEKLYQMLIQELGVDVAFVERLDRDPGNIVTLVKHIFNNFQRIAFDTQNVPSGVKVEISPRSCPGQIVNGNVCTGVQLGSTVTFNVTVTLQECMSTESDETVMVPIDVIGFGMLTINLETDCTQPIVSNGCSGNGSCSRLTQCTANLPCAQCAINLFHVATDLQTAFFTNKTLESLPNGTTLTFDAQSSTYRFRLPSGHCPAECSPQVVIVSGTDDMNYTIQDELAIGCLLASNCTYRYYVGINPTIPQFTEVHVEHRKCNPLPSDPTNPRLSLDLLWLIPGVTLLVGIIIILICGLLLIKDILEVQRLDSNIKMLKAHSGQQSIPLVHLASANGECEQLSDVIENPVLALEGNPAYGKGSNCNLLHNDVPTFSPEENPVYIEETLGHDSFITTDSNPAYGEGSNLQHNTIHTSPTSDEHPVYFEEISSHGHISTANTPISLDRNLAHEERNSHYPNEVSDPQINLDENPAYKERNDRDQCTTIPQTGLIPIDPEYEEVNVYEEVSDISTTNMTLRL